MFQIKRSLGVNLTAVTLIAISAPTADASVSFTFQRLSDTDAIKTATGAPDFFVAIDNPDESYRGLAFFGGC